MNSFEKGLLGLLLILFSIPSEAQVKFHSQNSLGMLEGEQGSFFQLQTVNGVIWKKWVGGIGLGLDYYSLKSIPLFLSVQRMFFKEGRGLFIVGDVGLNYKWDKFQANPIIGWPCGGQPCNGVKPDFKPGLYAGIGPGYKITHNNKKDALFLHLGYSFKQLIEKRSAQVFCNNPPCPPPQIITNNYRFNRISLRAGWAF